MRKKVAFLIAFLFLFGFVKYSFAVNPYCATPPFIQANLPSNIMLVLDYSGSMSWDAYGGNYDFNKTYYGYFVPNSMYKCSKWSCEWQDECNCDGYWYIDNSSSFDNSNDGTYKSDHGYYFTVKREYSGNVLNWFYMERIDILRWILTGGMTMGGCVDVKSCDIYSDKASCEANPLCKWRNFFIWHWCSNKSYCSSLEGNECSNNELCSLGESVVVTHDNIRIKKEDVSSYNPETGDVEGILQQIRRRQQRPRIGAAFFSGSIIGRVGLSYEYVKLINKINDLTPNGVTCTKCAVDEMEDLFSEDSSTIDNYNGKDPYKWGADNTTVRCAKNFILLMSDGEWNTGGDPVSYIDDMWKGGRKDLVSSLSGEQNVKTYPVAMFLDSINGKNALKWMAVYGNYNDLDNNGYPCNRSHYPNTSLTENENLENSSHCNEVKKNKDGTGPYGFFEGDNPEELKKAITEAFNEILKQASSGTAASVLATNGKSGATMLQALYWPKKYFDQGTSIDWSGNLYNLWLYLGPTAKTEEIRENSDETGESSDVKYLKLSDKVIQFVQESGKTKIKVCEDIIGNGQLTNCEVKSLEEIKPIWDAGYKLWNMSADDRNIFTNINKSKVDFTKSNKSQFKSFFGVNDDNKVDDLIDWVRGKDISGYRSRTVTIDNQTKVWKLGDIISSTPQVISINPVNSYYKKYGDGSYYKFNYDKYTGASKHQNRGMVFVGANDGMLHAFRFGKLSFPGGNVIAQLSRQSAGDLGSEAWAFIPKNVLPYLKYMSEKSYCHIYSVDLRPHIVDASINGNPEDDKTDGSWRTILVEGMGFGGSTSSIPTPDNSSVGKSSYFALDITDPENPTILWEFSDNNTGFTTTGPAIVHIPYKDPNTNNYDKNKNGYWYVVFASGPTTYKGDSNQSPYLYVLDLKTGTLKKKIALNISNGFVGNMLFSTIDLIGSNVNNGYSDDGLYFGYTYKDSSGNWKGGVIRVATDNDNDVDNWVVSKLIDGIGPITAGVKAFESNDNKLWLFFGSGRYFDRVLDENITGKLYGVQDPCYVTNPKENEYGLIDKSCTESVSISELKDVTNDGNANIGDKKGWYIKLDTNERLTANPIVSEYGWVFFTTFVPTNDICSFGGDSYQWMVNYYNGGTPDNPEGKLFIQTTTGQIKEIDLSEIFGDGYSSGDGTKQGRRTKKPSKPVVGEPKFMPQHEPIEQIIHWEEK